MEPTIVYKTPGPHFGPGDSSYDWKSARTADELAELKGQGWRETLGEALDEPAPALMQAAVPEPEAEIAAEAVKPRRGRQAKG